MSDDTLVDYPARPTAVVRDRVRFGELLSFFTCSISRVLAAMEEQGTTPGGEPFAYYRGVPDGSVDIEVGFPVADRFVANQDVDAAELPGGRVVTGVHVGPYARLGETYAAMRDWAIAHGLQPTDEMWEVYLTDPEREPDPER